VAAAQGEDVADPGLLQGAGHQLLRRQIRHGAVRRTLSAT
jgi:hypothetical protein